MRNRMIALLAGVMVVSLSGAALAAPSVDRILDLDLDYGDAELTYSLTGLTSGEVVVDFPEDFTFNHGQLLKFINSRLRTGWEDELGCLVRELAKSDLGKDGDSMEYSFTDLNCKQKDTEDTATTTHGQNSAGWVNPGQLKKAEKAHTNDD